jgi:hypothetical protein
MGLLDSIVGRAFRDEKVGRVVVFSGDRRNRGYILRSGADELKIRSFLKMFYFAHFSILLLAWTTFFINVHSFGDPGGRLLRTGSIALGIYGLVIGVPYFLLWKSYKKALFNFVSVEDEVSISGGGAGRQPWSVIVGLVALGTLVLVGGILFLIQAKR